MTTGIRSCASPVQVFQELYRRNLTEEEILAKLIEAKKKAKVVEVEDYKFRYDKETSKYEDNRISCMIERVLGGEEPNAVIK